MTSPDGPGRDPQIRDDALFARLGDAAKSHAIMLAQAARLARLGYFVFDLTRNKVEICSETHAAIFGRTPEEFMGLVTGLSGRMHMMHEDDADMVRAAYARLRAGETIEMEYRFHRKDGLIGHVREFVTPEFDASGRAVRGLGSSIDLTEAKLAENRASQARRLQTVGELTAGVAHDFNNILAVILGNAELAEDASGPEEAAPFLRSIVEAARRGSALTGSLLNFAQRAPISPRPVDLDAEVRSIVETFDRTLLRRAELRVRTPPQRVVGLLDRDQFYTVIVNLLINARDAVRPGGRIEVAVLRLDAAESQRVAARHDLAADTRYCAVEVRDDGCGIPRELIPRVTEPFFTTKSRAEGSGLGLSMALGFARQSGGTLAIRSKEGIGTRVRLFFPLAGGRAEADDAAPRERSDLTGLRLLLLEDDPALGKVLSAQLGHAGAQVTLTRSSGQCMDAIGGARFDVAILDNLVPGKLEGIDLAARVKAMHPQTATILLTGYASGMDRDRPGQIDAVLFKPVPFQDLLRTIRRVLPAAPGGTPSAGPTGR